MKMNKVVYAWYNEEQIFYVGIGSMKRSKSYHSRNLHCLRKRAKAERENSFEVRILYSDLTWEEACEIECQLIQQHGRIDIGTGCLTNMTEGGEGGSPWKGKKLTQEHKSKIGNSGKGRIFSQESKDKISKANSGKNNPNWGKTLSQYAREKLRKANLGNKYCCKPIMTPAGRFESSTEAHQFYRISRATIGRWLNDPRKPEFYRVT